MIVLNSSDMWRDAIECLAILDVLMSLAQYGMKEDSCMPVFEEPSDDKAVMSKSLSQLPAMLIIINNFAAFCCNQRGPPPNDKLDRLYSKRHRSRRRRQKTAASDRTQHGWQVHSHEAVWTHCHHGPNCEFCARF